MRLLSTIALVALGNGQIGCVCDEVVTDEALDKLREGECLSDNLRNELALGSYHCVCSVSETETSETAAAIGNIKRWAEAANELQSLIKKSDGLNCFVFLTS